MIKLIAFFNKNFLFLVLTALLIASCNSKQKEVVATDPWLVMQRIVDSIQEPVFQDSTFNVLDFGAISDGVTNNTLAFNNAINQCAANGGGKVLVPAGKYFSGAIHLKSNVNLHLDEGAEILFSTNPKDYYPLVHTSFEGIELMNYSPLIYAYKQSNIAVTGKGILNGQASIDNWWTWKGSKEFGWTNDMPSQLDSLNLPHLMKLSTLGTPVAERIFGDGHYLRPNFFEPFECNNVLIQGVKVINAPFWILHPIKSTNVIVDGVTIESHGPNNDGCDPEYSKNVLIKNCIFNTGDDCIAIKSGRDEDGRRVAIKSENIVVQNCKMIDGHGGVVMGSEISAGVRNVFVENCVMDSPELERAIRIKSNSRRGGVTENIYVRNIEVGQVKEAVLKINMFYGIYGGQTGAYIPTVKNVILENVTVKNGGKYGILAKGYKEAPITNVTLKNVTIEKVETPYSIENVVGIHFLNTYINGALIQDINN
ncbi:glycoside hydrolase family 28 protein [Lutibacter sp. HS1-25]|uniref:glycoside hydrolase family 28 protein n=1 Tax=Lutibacter sp. HS1-25 TaxID=2485000 RepID=UPI0010113F94|nr:glycoside hydrolase family 28 protein [Lutibacter sp. HS1-25]RXP46890.1 glycoside hydrolase family 28 protein [Lutibacter sp. HS1-25]